MCLCVLCHTTRLLVALKEWILFCPAVHKGQELDQGQLAAREDTAFTYRLFTPALMIGTLPDDGVSLGRVLVDFSQPIAGATHAGVAQKLLFYPKLGGVCHGGGGQGQVSRTPLLDEILGLLRDDGRVHRVGE